MSIYIIGRKGSKAVKDIVNNTKLKRYKGQPNAKLIVNYGVIGPKLNSILNRHKIDSRKIKILNRQIGKSKYNVLKDVEAHDILIPKSLKTLPKKAKLSEWLEKRNNSQKGYGIKIVTKRNITSKKYYQYFVKDRKYELRVIAFSWIKKDSWVIQKRVGPANQITWNYNQGGSFSAIKNTKSHGIFQEALETSEKVLKILNMSFGAVDYIVDDNLNLYFLEINSCPGFTEYSSQIYFNAFNSLK